MEHVFTRCPPSRNSVCWFLGGMALIYFTLAAFIANVGHFHILPGFLVDGIERTQNGAFLVVFGIPGGLLLMFWQGGDVAGWFFAPRRIVLDDHGLSLGRKTIAYADMLSVQINHDRGRLKLRYGRNRTFTFRLDLINDSGLFYDILSQKLSATLLKNFENRLTAGDAVRFGKIEARNALLRYKGYQISFTDIISIRTQSESGAGSIEYLVFRMRDGRSVKIDRDHIVNEPVLLDIIGTRLPA